VPCKLTTVDPLGRLRKITLETWSAAPDPKRLAAAPGKALPGDSEHKTITVKYENRPVTEAELELPPLKQDQVYYCQPSYVDGEGTLHWRSPFALNLGLPLERREVTLRYAPKAERKQRVELTTEAAFQVRGKGRERSVSAQSRSELTEEPAAGREGERRELTLRYTSHALAIKEDGKVVQGDEVKQAVRSLDTLSTTLGVGADGAAVDAKADLSKVPATSRQTVERLNYPVLQALQLVTVPLLPGPLKPLRSWEMDRTVLLGVPQPGQGLVVRAETTYTYRGTRLHKGREIAFLDIKGTVKGLPGTSAPVVGTVTGVLEVSVDSGEVLGGNVIVQAEADVDSKGGGKARIQASFKAGVRRDVLAAPSKKE
jgi:hypothetical protein